MSNNRVKYSEVRGLEHVELGSTASASAAGVVRLVSASTMSLGKATGTSSSAKRHASGRVESDVADRRVLERAL